MGVSWRNSAEQTGELGGQYVLEKISQVIWFILEPLRSQAPFTRYLIHRCRDESVDEFRKRRGWNPKDNVPIPQSGLRLFHRVRDIIRVNLNVVEGDSEGVMEITLDGSGLEVVPAHLQ